MGRSHVSLWGVATFLCNLISLQSQFCAPYGSNAPLWSLGFEWFYYLTFPLILGMMPRILAPLQIGAWLALKVPLLFVFPDFCFFHPNFDTRSAVSYSVSTSNDPSLGQRTRVRADSSVSALPQIPHQYWAISQLCARYRRSVIDSKSISSITRKWHDRLASFSYSLYVVHHPILVIYLSVLVSANIINERTTVSVSRVLFFGGGCCSFTD